MKWLYRDFNKISWQTNLFYLVIFLTYLTMAIIGRIHWWFTLVTPIVYVLMWLHIRIFVWDIKKPFDITVAIPDFKVNDIIKTGLIGFYGIVLSVGRKGNAYYLTVMPVKITKNKFANRMRLMFIKVELWLWKKFNVKYENN